MDKSEILSELTQKVKELDKQFDICSDISYDKDRFSVYVETYWGEIIIS